MSAPALPDDMLSAMEDGYMRCETRVDAFANRLASEPPPSIVYHYTDSAGLLGILQSGTVRLTDIFGVNDPSEVLHGVKRAGEILTRNATSAHPAARPFAAKFVETIEQHFQSAAHFFVAYFSQDNDDLGQWRAYADNGNGFALGFDGAALERAFAGQRADVLNATFPITYDDRELSDIYTCFSAVIMPLIALPQGRQLSNDVINEYMKLLSIKLALSVFRAALLFKHEAYKAEQEYRFLQVRAIDDPLRDLKVRARRHSLVRFTEFDWKMRYLDVLREIVIGPSANENSARSFVADSLRMSGLKQEVLRVWQSKIPYRG